ncbi:hypothetical protein BCR35DRAFT_27601, partial [Leucosporidium creatinivorum]
MPSSGAYYSPVPTGHSTNKRPRRVSLSDQSNTLTPTTTSTLNRPSKRLKPIDSPTAGGGGTKSFLPSLFDWIRGKTSPRPPLARLPTSRPPRSLPHPQHTLQQYSKMTPLPHHHSSSQSRLRPTNPFSLPRSFLNPSTPAPAAPAPAPTPPQPSYDKLLADWKWECTIAKAAGKPEPPRPVRPRVDKDKGKIKQGEGEGEYRKKKPMGVAQHKTEVARYVQHRQQQLVEQNQCMSIEKQEMQSSMEFYRRSVDAFKLSEALEPSSSLPAVAVKRRSSTKQREKKAGMGVDHALETAKRTMAAYVSLSSVP